MEEKTHLRTILGWASLGAPRAHRSQHRLEDHSCHKLIAFAQCSMQPADVGCNNSLQHIARTDSWNLVAGLLEDALTFGAAKTQEHNRWISRTLLTQESTCLESALPYTAEAAITVEFGSERAISRPKPSSGKTKGGKAWHTLLYPGDALPFSES
eukprot:742144-Pelagomonas_calceolata.AAC.3